MGKTDDKGEPVKTVTIGGKKVEVPIIFVLPEESGEKEIERYERPKVHIKKDDKAAESKEEPLEELTDGKLEEVEKPKFVAPKIAGGYGKAQAIKRVKELQDKRRKDAEAKANKEKKQRATSGMLNYNYMFDKPNIEEGITHGKKKKKIQTEDEKGQGEGKVEL